MSGGLCRVVPPVHHTFRHPMSCIRCWSYRGIMKAWLLRISVVLCALLCAAYGGWWVWREWYSADQLYAAMSASDYDRADGLLAWGGRRERPFDELTRLDLAIVRRDPELVQKWLESGVDPNVADKDGWTPLHVAARTGDAEITRILLQAGADVNVANKMGRFALRIATDGGHIETVRVLLDFGADVNAADVVGVTALRRASDGIIGAGIRQLDAPPKAVYKELARQLLRSGADPYIQLPGEGKVMLYGLKEIVKEVEVERSSNEPNLEKGAQPRRSAPGSP